MCCYNMKLLFEWGNGVWRADKLRNIAHDLSKLYFIHETWWHSAVIGVWWMIFYIQKNFKRHSANSESSWEDHLSMADIYTHQCVRKANSIMTDPFPPTTSSHSCHMEEGSRASMHDRLCSFFPKLSEFWTLSECWSHPSLQHHRMIHCDTQMIHLKSAST